MVVWMASEHVIQILQSILFQILKLFKNKIIELLFCNYCYYVLTIVSKVFWVSHDRCTVSRDFFFCGCGFFATKIRGLRRLWLMERARFNPVRILGKKSRWISRSGRAVGDWLCLVKVESLQPNSIGYSTRSEKSVWFFSQLDFWDKTI